MGKYKKATSNACEDEEKPGLSHSAGMVYNLAQVFKIL
jgi:hypothetical protein